MVAEVPGPMSPVSKVPSAVAVCAVPSWLATVTFAPGLTVSDGGANLKPEMVTEGPLDAAGLAAPPDPAAVALAPAGSRGGRARPRTPAAGDRTGNRRERDERAGDVTELHGVLPSVR